MKRFPLFGKRWHSLGKFLSLSLACCFLIISCTAPKTATPPTSSEVTQEGTRLSVGFVEKPRTLDPADGYEVVISDIITSLGDRLYTYVTDTDQLEPQLATAMPTVSDDGLTYTIPVREGVTFHDGEPFNAEAMAFSLRRFSENGGKPSSLLSDIMESVEATGEYELTIQLKQPFAAFPSLLAFPGMSAVSPKAYEIGEGKFKPNDFVGTGPYKLASFSPDLIKVDAFENYWGEKPENQGIDFRFFSNAANLYNSFVTGSLDIAYRDLDADQVLSLRDEADSKGYQVVAKPSSRLDYLVLNTQLEPLNRVEVRQAIAAIIDRPLIIDRVYRGQADPAYSIIPTNFETNQPVFKAEYGDGNIEKAKQLLTQVGFSQDNPFEFEIWYASNNPQRQQMVTLLQEYVAQNLDGLIAIVPQPVESTSLFSNISKGIYQSYLVAWFPDFGDADNYVHPFFYCAVGAAETGCEEGASRTQGFFYYNERMNELIEAQRQEQDQAARQEIFAEIQDILARDVPLVPILQKKDYAFAQQPVEGIEINPVIGVSFWEVEKEA